MADLNVNVDRLLQNVEVIDEEYENADVSNRMLMVVGYNEFQSTNQKYMYYF